MKYRILGKTGLKVSEVGCGTWQLAKTEAYGGYKCILYEICRGPEGSEFAETILGHVTKDWKKSP